MVDSSLMSFWLGFWLSLILSQIFVCAIYRLISLMNRIKSSALWQASCALFIMSDIQIIKSNYKFYIYQPFQIKCNSEASSRSFISIKTMKILRCWWRFFLIQIHISEAEEIWETFFVFLQKRRTIRKILYFAELT